MGEFTDQMLELFPDTVVVRKMTPPDEFGNQTLISVRNLPARVVGKIKAVKDIGGNEVTSSVQATFPGVYNLSVNDEYILPERFEPRNPKPISVGHATDENGPEHERVYFYWTQVG